jgi:hypothetical protein
MAKKASTLDNSKVAIMMVMDQFAQAGFFKEKECTQFVTQILPQLADGALFKVKKYMIPCIFSIAPSLSYDSFKAICVGLFLKSTTDLIWGVRRVCLENMSKLIDLLKPTETEILI